MYDGSGTPSTIASSTKQWHSIYNSFFNKAFIEEIPSSIKRIPSSIRRRVPQVTEEVQLRETTHTVEYRGYSKLRTHTAIGPYGRFTPRCIGPS